MEALRSGAPRRRVYELDSRANQCRDRRLSGLDARRIRFLSDGVRAERHRRRVQYRNSRRCLRHHVDAGGAPGRRTDLRQARRQVRAPSDADARHRPVFDPRTAVGLLAEPDHAARAAHAVRHRAGRRMGRRHRAGDGDRAAARARLRVGPAAGRLSERLSAGVDRVRHAVPAHRLARHVLRRRHPRAAGAVHPHERARIARLRDHGQDSSARGCGRRSSRTGSSRSTASC